MGNIQKHRFKAEVEKTLMSRGKMFIVMAVALGLAVASSANARSSYYFGFNSGPAYAPPVYYPAYPVYPVAPPPPPVYYHPRPVYAYPAPVFGSGFSFGFSTRR